ncbi:MAG: STAS domain-containing protein [Oscillospiraceae bacterium]|jgi:anti-sigma B factor antagonist|nr:STAS domain-containing protein [Oscillospiraceae bacterium]
MLNIVKKQDGDTLTVKLDGRLDTNTAPDFQTEMEPLLNDISKLVLDFEKLDYISSAGLRVLLTFEQEMEEQEKTLEVTHVNDIIHDVFDVTGFLDILTIV